MISSASILWLIHMAALSGLAVYGLHRIWFILLWNRARLMPFSDPALPKMDKIPQVTVQLPLYNERFVAKRLIDAAAALDWPGNLLEIQVLDDSSDATREIVDKRVAHWQSRGVCIEAIRRENRDGFKAGALARGLTRAKGEFVAVFDADFVPGKDFLIQTVARFADATVGMVQCRWDFLNEEHSWLTRIQALLLATHFRIEHYVRSRYNLFFNFNGTAGIWRKTAISEAGGWQSDTVTEDLDISYRAQLCGWRFVYLDDYAVASELPTTMSAFRNQQQRWTKGAIQTARKLLPAIFLSKNITAFAKLEAAAHLLSNLGWLLCMVMTLTLYPAVKMNETPIAPYLLQVEGVIFFFSSGAVLLYFFVYAQTFHATSKRYLPLIPILSIGMAPVLSFAVMSGLLTTGGIFRRTPKYGVLGRTRLAGSAFIYQGRSLWAMIINIPILCYTILPVIFLWDARQGAVVFPLLFPLGFIWVIFKDIQDAMTCRSRRIPQDLSGM